MVGYRSAAATELRRSWLDCSFSLGSFVATSERFSCHMKRSLKPSCPSASCSVHYRRGHFGFNESGLQQTEHAVSL